MKKAYPLTWPDMYPRTARPVKSNFAKRSLAIVTDLLKREIKRLEGSEIIISTNIPLRLDGMPYSDYERRVITDKGVAVYFTWKKKQMVLACDRWTSIEENMYAICLSIEAMRGLERWGVSDILERSFTGFQALPAPSDCWTVLGIAPTQDPAEIKAAWRNLIKAAQHDADALARANRARDEANNIINR